MDIRYYQVGGSVRDKLLGVESKDIDYAVEAPSFDAMLADIQSRGGEVFLAKPEYLCVRAKFGQQTCDYVLCRKDGSYYDGRRPESVEPGTIFDDLARRDFTVNAMALDYQGKLIDPHEGAKDLQLKQLRTVGKAGERFTEDGLRILRALRFAITKGLNPVLDIQVFLSDSELFIPRLRGVSQERIMEELKRCFKHDTPATLARLSYYPTLREFLFSKGLWLKPTLESK